MRIIEQHHTPDGLLTFQVKCDQHGDYCLGFAGYAWHTHPDILTSVLGMPQEQAMRKFVDDLVGNRAIIAVVRVAGGIRDVRIVDEPVSDPYQPEDETIEFRYWDGRLAS